MPQPGIAKSTVAKFTIGRDKNCDVAIADDSVSRIHAELSVLDGGKLLLADTGSSNGTAVLQGGQLKRIEQAYVVPTDQVQFGSVVLTVEQILEAIDSRARSGGKTPPGAGGKLIRCECGAIKPAGSKCQECGQ
jgi:pSer/pThr/pTyr-binding forkhead associated (FHA) protein